MQIVFERGCEVSSAPAVVGEAVLLAPDGFRAERYAGRAFEGASVETVELSSLRMVSFGSLAPETVTGDWSMRVAGIVVPEESGTFQLALAQAGSARLFVDGQLLLDGFTNPPPPGGSDFFGMVSQDLVAEVVFERGEPVELLVEFARTGDALSGFRVGFRTADQDALLERAVAAAAEAEVAIVCIGTTGETESEGHDRKDLELPGRQEELIRRVAAVNGRTVVVVNAGAPIAMSWADDVASVLQCWFGDRRWEERWPTSWSVRPSRAALAHHDSLSPRAQSLACQLSGRERGAALRRGRVHGVPGVRAQRAAAPVPVRPRPELHQV